MRYLLLVSLLAIAQTSDAAAVPASPTDLSTAHRLVTLVDYIGADYPGAVDANGRILNEFEFREHQTLASEAAANAAGLYAPGPTTLLTRLKDLIDARATPAQIDQVCREARQELVERFALPTFPASPPSRAHGEALYRANCSGCHGDDGRGLTALATELTPPPADLHDPQIALGLSPFRIFNTVSFGVPGTSMPSFGEAMPEADRWAVAFYLPTLRFRNIEAVSTPALPMSIAELAVETDLSLLNTATARGLDSHRAEAALAYARTAAPFEAPPSPLEIARRHLDVTVAATRADRWDDAASAALRGYLDGVEPVEGPLRAIRPHLAGQIEGGFLDLREAIRKRAPVADVETMVASLANHLDSASQVLENPKNSHGYAFIGAFLIILREGVEAALVVGAMLTLLRRAKAPPAMVRQVHVAWVTALVAGVLTWLAASQLVPVDPAHRELAEGIIALLASALLFSASYWLLSNLEVRRWMDFLKSRLTNGLGGARRFTLFSVSFLAVYREAFETVLFLQAMLLGSEPLAVLAGVGAAALTLLLVVGAMFRIGARLPIKPFFAISSGLLGLLAFVLAGQGVHALQQVGVLGAARLPVPDLPSLGIHATFPGLAVQGLIVLLFAGAIVYTFARRAQDPRDARPQA